MAKTIFISHAKEDREGADHICRLLEERGVSCWIAPRDVPAGSHWASAIMHGLEQTRGLVLVLTEHGNISRYVRSEVERAFSAGKPVFPVRLRNIEPHRSLQLFLSGSQWVDAWDPPIETHMDRLAASIKSMAAASSSRVKREAGAAPGASAAAPAATRETPASESAQPSASPAVAARQVKQGFDGVLRWLRRQSVAKKSVLAGAILLVLILGLWGGRPVRTISSIVIGGSGAGNATTFDGIEFAWIPAGSFTMGSPESEQGRSGDATQHQVTLTKGFWLGKYEVTQAQWQKVMGSNPSGFKGDNLPVDSVSWSDCQDFVGKLNKSGNGPHRLPTEAEWEYACRAGASGAYDYGSLDDQAWYGQNSGNQTHPVGQKKANAWGLYDMRGNAWEWCKDVYGPYPATAVTDPQGAQTGGSRVLRGGSWLFDAFYCRAAYRSNFTPGSRLNYLGFRVVRTP